jgi:bleomycin hydrolase
MRKLKKITFVVLLAGMVTSVSAQEKCITSEQLKQFRQQSVWSGSDKAIANAVAVNGLKSLAVAGQNDIPGGTYFSNEVKSKGITNQEKSGRCWLFTGLNILRAKMIQHQHLGEFQFSENYVFFYDQLEKSNLFLQSIIDNVSKPMDDRLVEWLFKNPISDGGQFTGIADLITKYGVVPAECMPETYNSNNTGVYADLLSEKLREYGLQLREMYSKGTKVAGLMAQKQKMLGEVYKILVRCFGLPPEKFTWMRTDSEGKPVSTREYTPLDFYKEYLGNDLQGNYIMFMNDPARAYYKTYEIDLDRHAYDGHNWMFVNVPIEDMKEMAVKSIKDSTMMYLSCDVSKFLDSKRGYSDPGNYDYADLLGTDFPMNKKDRIQTFASGSTHAMTLMAVDIDATGSPRKWMVENSWGADYGFKGHIIMSDKWFSEYVFRLVVEKKYISEKLQQIAKEKATLLPAWDPLFSPEP